MKPHRITRRRRPPVPAILLAASLAATARDGDWCQWLDDNPGRLYKDKDNPWIQSFELGGRFHYQAAHVGGTDENGMDFHDSYDEYRRFRLETETRFLRFLTAEFNINLVDDERFAGGPDNNLHWGYQGFDQATLELDLGKATDLSWLDGASLRYGRMKFAIGEELHQSSNEIFTVERSDLSDQLGAGEGRPTGLLVDYERDRWTASAGLFSNEDDADFIGGWNDGSFLLTGFSWRPAPDWTLRLERVDCSASGRDKALGYASSTTLGAVWDRDRHGLIANLAWGDNGGAGHGNAKPERQGDFGGLVVMPWYWLVDKRLQLVLRYQLMLAAESEGINVSRRYLRGEHDHPFTDLNNGRGDELQSLYLGLNYHLCGDRTKLMGGLSYDQLGTPDSRVETLTWLFALRTSF
jgi:hypothetical protein